jgi:PAS domain S-box-containing protein
VDGEVFWRKDGTSFLVEYTSSPIRERGEIVGAVLVFRDVSERRRAEEAQLRATVAEAANQRLEKEIVERQRVEEALRESEERWQLALRGNNDGIWDWNVKTCEMVFSPRCKEMLGFQEHEIANYLTAWAQLVHPDDIGWVTQAIQDHWAKKTPFYISEHRVRCKDGSYKWILDRGQALWDDAGNAVRMVGSHTDITERKQAEATLLRLSSAVRMSTDSIVIADLEGKIVELNEATLRMYGAADKGDLLGKSAFELIVPEDRAEAFAGMEETLDKGFIRNREYQIILKDGSTLPVEMSVALMKDAGGNPVGFVGISRDITERREAELALRQAKDAAEAANRAKSEFLATMSHELRTSLSVILGYSDLMAEGEFGSVTDKQSETLERIRRNALELNELIASVLDLSRIEAGRLPVDVKEVQIPTVLEELKAETQEVYQRSRLHFGWEREAGLVPIRTDPEKLKVVLRNLIGNAVKFTPQGSITVKASPKRGGVEVSVTDTGVGIPSDAVADIFEPFRQVDSSATRQYGGAGLGLHIVKRLLELLGGNIAVESEVGRGSTFRVWLPSDRRVQPKYMGFH